MKPRLEARPRLTLAKQVAQAIVHRDLRLIKARAHVDLTDENQ